MFRILLLLLPLLASSQLDESERIAEYHKRQHKWPPAEEDFTPRTPGWRNLHTRRFQQISRIEDGNSKYNGYMSAVHSALLAPNFTEYGWALTKGPPDLVELLLSRLITGMEREDTPVELPDSDQGDIRDEYPGELPLMVSISGLHRRVIDDLLPMHEAWSSTKLIGNNAYGLRVYRNQSNLQMHIDESATHIISSIMHIGHDPDGEPWPLVIEDLHGNTHEVFLETGDVVLYESSKCFHGRPKRYNGKWYSSIFTHYYPVDWDPKRNEMDSHYRIPPGWHLKPEEVVEELDELIVTETSFKEPGCEHEWCALKKTTKWTMPQELQHGQIISSDGVIKSFVKESDDEL